MARNSRRAAAMIGASGFVLCAVAACGVTLPDAPFACDADGLCPDGFSCRSTVCVRDGVASPVARPMRVTWINASEMYWFASKRGGATLVVNEGFTPGGRGLYELSVAADGTVAAPRLILDFGEEFPTSSAVIALDDDSYGVLTLRFPSVDEDAQELVLYRVDRDRDADADVAVEVLYRDNPPYLGGTEPAYIGAVAGASGIDICFADPSDGGSVIVRRIDGDSVSRELEIELPAAVLPLSGDCLLWQVGDDLVLRLGLEAPELYRIPASATTAADVEGPIELPGLPVYAVEAGYVSLQVAGDGLSASLALFDGSGGLVEETDLGAFQEDLEPHTGWASPGGVLFAPASSTADFADLQVVALDNGTFSTVAAVAREATDQLYSARAFSDGEHVYVAWTSFHEDLMDLWVAVAPEGQ